MFRMGLLALNDWRTVEVTELPEDIFAINSLEDMILYACEQLDSTKKFEFYVSGFGQIKWPTDVWIDLATIMEQIGGLENELKNSDGSYSLDFFEQGIERLIQISWESDILTLFCLSRTEWKPNPQVMEMSKHKFLDIVHSLHEDFCIICKTMMPILSRTEYFQKFCLENDR